MKTKILFEEVQKQNQKWIWFLILALDATFLITFIQEKVLNIPLNQEVLPVWIYIIIFGTLSLVTIFLLFSKLKTKITEDTISIQYTPIHRKAIEIKKEEIEDCYVRLYRPIAEYGGWGVRTAFNGKNGKAYNVSGKIGIQLELKSGEKILIGTQSAKLAELALNQFKSAQ
ncbi:MAG: hypothetical protein R2799_02535 [Crocinitomicaceae bacterium]